MTSMTNETYKQARIAEAKFTGQKFCTNCQKRKSVEGGVLFKSGKISRWKCKTCAAKMFPNE